jgi:hypothetical protein
MSEDRNLSGEEKRALLREQYKQEFRERKQILQDINQAQRGNKLSQTLSKMAAALGLDDTEAWTKLLNDQSTVQEAKLDMALEGAQTQPETPAADPYEHLTALERFKIENGLMPPPAVAPAAPNPEEATTPAPEEQPKTLDLPIAEGVLEAPSPKSLELPEGLLPTETTEQAVEDNPSTELKSD